MRGTLIVFALALLGDSCRQAWAQCVSDYAGLSGCLSGCAPTPAPIITTTVAACLDLNINCAGWADQYCESNKQWMESNCPVSCYSCAQKLGCTDRHDPVSACVQWKGEGRCAGGTGNAYVLTNCANTCNTCAAALCVDNNKQCAGWAAGGHCTASAAYMDVNCPLSCRHNGC